MKSKTKKLTASMDSSIPLTVGASSSSIVPSASSSRGTKKFLSFKKKSEGSLPAPPPNPIKLNDDGQPSQWQFGESLGPALPLSSANVLKAFLSMDKQYYHHFKEVQSSLRGDHPSSSKHFICIQDWVLEYNNTVHDSDLSAQLTSLLVSDPGPMNMDDLSGLLFPSLPEFNPKYQESLSWLPSHSPTWLYGDILCMQRMYNHASPHFPYLLEHQYPACQPMKRAHTTWIGILTIFSKFHMLLEIIKLEDAEAQLCAVSQLLMHRTINHIALVTGLELPQFGVNHALVGAFFSMAEVIVKEITEHDTSNAHGEFLEIWRMRPVAEVKRPSPWIIKFPIGRGDESQQSRALYNDLFESCLQDVDSHMAGALAHVLGPGTITLCDTVPLPCAALLSPPRDPTPQPTLPTGSMDLNLVDAVMPDFNADPSSSDEEGSIDDWNPRLQRRKAHTAVAAQADPLWDAVQKDLPVAAWDWASAEYSRIVPMIQVAQNKHRVWRTPLEEYLLAEWTEWHRSIQLGPILLLWLVSMVVVIMIGLICILLAISALIHVQLPASAAIHAHSVVIAPLPMIVVAPLPMIIVTPLPMIVVALLPMIITSLFPMIFTLPLPAVAILALLEAILLALMVVLFLECQSLLALDMPSIHGVLLMAPQTPPGHPSTPPVIPGDSFEALQPPPDRPSTPPVVPSDSFKAPQMPPGCPSTLSTFPGGAIPETANPAATNPAATNPAATNPAAANSAAADPATTNPIATNLAVVNPVVVPLATWFRIELSGVTEDVDIPWLFKLFQATGLIGVQVQKNKMAKGAAHNKKVLLSFKSEQRRNAVLSLLCNLPEHRLWPFNEVNTVHVDCQEALDLFHYVLCPEYVQMCYLHQQSPVDLTEMMENAPPYRDLGDLRWFHLFPLPVAATSIKAFLRYSLLELNRYPPIAVEGFTLGAPQIMDRIEFTTAWLVRTLDEEYTAT
ncbi:hypothetical protein BS47DRAFT_1363975 [Hydnum rufescens UP504]|uniref:Uncharacterized protein n=1 Tax=Hydnum rufescens UP504 TaxID=1448309 RepID=A0A9P6ASS1_9AGAM|nr:hypothetical protein BS47DRAFT_1363975 [Hydnum rufescens UP504]